MGIFDSSAKAGEGVIEAFGKGGGAVLAATGAAVAAGARGIGKVVAGGTAAAAGFIKGAASRPGSFAKGIAGLAVVGVVVGTAVHFIRGSKRKEAQLEPMTAALVPPTDLPATDTMMGLEPAPGALAEQEMARRGAMGQAQGVSR
jgi:hypothetical protein